MHPSDHGQSDLPNGAPEGQPTRATGPEGDRWLRSVVENSSEIVTVVDPDGTLRYANPAWERALGYDPDEAVGTMNVLDHVHPEDLAHVLEETEEALAQGGITTNEAEYRFRHKDGSWRWMESVGTYLLEDPEVGGVVVVSRDVTERKESEEALRRSEAEIFSILESITDAFFALDHELRFTYVNPQAEVLLNRSREDLVGERIWEDPTFYPEYRKAMAEGKTVKFEGYYPPLEAWYSVRAYPSESGLSVYFQDVTERKEAEERLRFQSVLLGAVGESVIALDVEGRVLYWNEAAEEMYGWSSEEAMGHCLREMVLSEDLLGRAEEIMAEVREGKTWAGELEVRRKDGSTFPVEGTDTPVFGEDGGLVGVIGVLRDITGRKESEERLREAEERYRTLVERVPAVTYIQQATAFGAVTYVSPQMKDLLGYEPKECTSHAEHWLKIIHPEDRERVLAEDRRVNETGEPFSMEYRQFAKDGRVVWVRDEATLVRDDGGEPLYWLGVQTDVTERKLATEALKESEERYRIQSRELALLHQVRSALAQELDLPTVLYKVVEATAETYGYTQVSAYLLEGEELVLQHQVGYERVIERIPVSQGVSGRTVRTGQPILLEDVRADGDFLGAVENITSEICVPLFDEDRAVGFINVESRGGVKLNKKDFVMMVALGEHVSVALSRARLYTRVRRSEEYFRSLIRNASDVITVLDADGAVRYVSPAIERMLGYLPEQRVGSSGFELLHPEDLPRARHALDEVLRSRRGITKMLAVRMCRQDGSWRDVELTATNLLDDPSVRGIVLNWRDVTERKEAEDRLRAAEERYRTVVEEQTELVCRFAPDLTLTFVNGAYCRYFGQAPAELIGGTFLDHIPEEDRALYDEGHFRLTRENPTRTVEHRVFTPGGELRWQQWTDTAVFDAAGRVVEFQSVGRDVTGRREAEESLKKSEASLARTQRLAHLGGWEWDIETDAVSWSDEVYRIYGLAPGSTVPNLENFIEVVHPEDRDLVRKVIDEALYERKPYNVEHRVVRPDGEVRVVHRRAEVVRDEAGQPIKIVGTVHDVTERKVLEERLEHWAFYDSLTDLPNRQLFMDRLEQALRRTRRRKNPGTAMLFMDLDGFKVVNDSLGHEVGDRLLVAVAGRLRGCLRPEDTLARFGGDEFVMLIEDVDEPADAVRIAARIVEELRAPFTLEGRELYVAVSIGVALGSERTRGPDDLVRDADTAMYRAKDEGSGYKVFDPDMYDRALSRLEVENDLRRAIEREEFAIHYQPIFDLGTGGVRGVEALVRWDHPERGLQEPSEFVAVAEESGLVVPMGEQVLKEACLRAKAWQEEYPRIPPLAISVNLSARQLSRPDLAATVERVLEETGLEGNRLTLDVTETVYVRALESNTTTLERLKGMGVRMSIDDFGTGYSSLSYLKRLPVDILKIDQSFVGGLGESIEDTAIVRMMIDLAHTLGMEVIAEGVEGAGQLARLREMGCDMAQGSHFAKPLPPQEASTFLMD